MPSTIINGVNLYYECHGEGEPLMLIAGLASDSRSWLPVVEPLSRRFLLSLCLVIPWGVVWRWIVRSAAQKEFPD